jgi:hypothetical protein
VALRNRSSCCGQDDQSISCQDLKRLTAATSLSCARLVKRILCGMIRPCCCVPLTHDGNAGSQLVAHSI